MIQLVWGTVTVIFSVLSPFLGLGLGDKLAEDIHINALRHIMLTGMYPVPFSILTAELGVAARRGNQKGFNIPFKTFLAFIHHDVPTNLLISSPSKDISSSLL